MNREYVLKKLANILRDSKYLKDLNELKYSKKFKELDNAFDNANNFLHNKYDDLLAESTLKSIRDEEKRQKNMDYATILAGL